MTFDEVAARGEATLNRYEPFPNAKELRSSSSFAKSFCAKTNRALENVSPTEIESLVAQVLRPLAALGTEFIVHRPPSSLPVGRLAASASRQNVALGFIAAWDAEKRSEVIAVCCWYSILENPVGFPLVTP